jgi:subtilisin family serine protease
LCWRSCFPGGGGAKAQYVSLPSSAYEADILIVWFQNGIVNPQYLGCDSEYDATGYLDFSPAMFTDQQIYTALAALNVQSVRKVVPNLTPCADTVSIARRGDTIRVPEVWNILRFELDLTGHETSIPDLAYLLTVFYHPLIRIATPSIVARFEYPYDDEELFWSEPAFSKAMIDVDDINDPRRTGLYNVSYGPWAVNYGTNVFDAWDLARGSSEIKVAVVDDGAYVKSNSNSTFGHEDFSHQSYGNVFIDGRNYRPGQSKYYENTTHGTRIAGIIGAITNNAKGIAGIAGGSGIGDFVRMYALKVGHKPSGGHYTVLISAMAAAIFEAASTSQNGLGVDLINLSIQEMPSQVSGIGCYDPVLHAAVAFAYRNDVPIFNSIGNNEVEIRQNEMMACPASAYENHIIVVGAHRDGERHSPSAYGAEVLDLLAPWANISTGSESSSESGYFTFHGTSSAAPHACGVAALMLELVKNGMGQQNLPPYLAVEDYLQVMAEARSAGPQKTPGQPLTKNNEEGYGIINAKTTLDLLTTPYELKHISIPYIAEAGTPDTINDVTITSSEHAYPPSQQNNDYIGSVMQYEFTVTVPLGATYTDVLRVWVRGADTKGFSDLRWVTPLPNRPSFYHTLYSDCGWARVNEFGTDWAEISAYLYQIYDNGSWVWLNGISPADIVFDLSILSGPPIATGVLPMPTTEAGLFELYPSVVGANTADVHIVLKREYGGQLHIHDVLGRLVKSLDVSPGQERITLRAADIAQNGVYFIRPVAGYEGTVRKLVVAR